MLESMVEVFLNNIFKDTCLDPKIVVELDITNKDIVLIVKFTPFDTMEVKTNIQVKQFTKTLIRTIKP
jgi:hypothetical protein